MANPFPFVAGSVLTAAELNGIGEATAYTPTITNGSLGNGTITGSYVQVNKLVYGAIKFALGTTSTITGQLQFSFPITNWGCSGCTVSKTNTTYKCFTKAACDNE
jgi:hypothetical protein